MSGTLSWGEKPFVVSHVGVLSVSLLILRSFFLGTVWTSGPLLLWFVLTRLPLRGDFTVVIQI